MGHLKKKKQQLMYHYGESLSKNNKYSKKHTHTKFSNYNGIKWENSK